MTAAIATANETGATTSQAPRLLTILFGFCMFSTGASGLVHEYVLATMTTYILGNSIEQFSIIIALMMLMMGVSGLVQKHISDHNLIEKFMWIEIGISLLGGFAPIAIYAAFGFMTDHFLLIHYGLVCTIGFLIGFEIPIVMRIINKHGFGIKTNLKVVFAMDYIGAFVGALVWVYILMKIMPLTEISFVVAGVNFVVAAATLLYFMWKGLMKRSFTTLLLLLATSALLYSGYTQNRDWSKLMEQRFYEDPIVAVETTPYQHLVLTKNEKLGDVRLYINGHSRIVGVTESVE